MRNWLLDDNRRLAYRETGTGRPLVLLHGWSMSSAVFTETLPALADHFRVLAPDLRGHGLSEGGSGYALDDLADDLRMWLEGLKIDSFDLLGWSLGGQVALRLASQLGPRVRRLLLVAATPCFVAGEGWTAGLPAGQVKAMARGLRRRYQETLEDFFHRQFVAGEISAERLRQIKAFAAPVIGDRIPAAEPILAALETLQTTDLRRELKELQVPTMVVHGEGDDIIPCEAGRYLATNLPHGSFFGLPDTGHAPFLTRPEQCCNLLREFCRP